MGAGWLVRHTQVRIDVDLQRHEWQASPEGLQSARKLASHAVFRGAEVIVSSPEPKALATAQAIADAQAASLTTATDLREVGRPRGLVSAEEYETNVAAYLSGRKVSGWEPQQRARERVDRLIAQLPQTAVAVSHGLLLSLHLRYGFEEWALIPMPGVLRDDRWIS